MATPHEPEAVWKTSVPAPAVSAPPAAEAVNKAPKGKEKAAKGPLRLLDLPVDVLKEIIHQVHTQTRKSHGCYALSAPGMLT
jgi:hypothetical protein